MWQKERLLNLALAAVPPECRTLAWVDADVIFDRTDWAEEAQELLDRFPVVQLFETVHYLPPEFPLAQLGRVQPILNRNSISSLFAQGHKGDAILPMGHQHDGSLEDLPVEQRGATGFAWAFRRELFQDRGLYDAAILGAGDRAMVTAAHGFFDIERDNRRLNPPQFDHFLRWARPFHQDVHGRVGVLPGHIYHLWHGDLKNRNFCERHRSFAAFQFDPYNDLALADNGSWRWNTHKPEMHQFVINYFLARKEDGEPTSDPHPEVSDHENKTPSDVCNAAFDPTRARAG
jgi:hypothetical protein